MSQPFNVSHPSYRQVNITEALEALIDQSSVLHVLTGLELICAEKAEHIRHNWSDRTTARLWDNASRIAGRAARSKTLQV